MAAPKRPAGVTVIAILNLIFGGLGLCGMLCAIVGLGFLAIMMNQMPPPTPGQPDPTEVFSIMYKSVQKNAPSAIYFMIGSLVLSTIMTVVLFSSGLGLLKLRDWARSACFLYAIVTIASNLGSTVYSIMVLNPAMEQMQKDIMKWVEDVNARQAGGKVGGAPPPAANPFAGNPMMNAVGNVAGSIIGIAYAIVLMVVMMLPDVKKAFDIANGRATATTDLTDYDDRRATDPPDYRDPPMDDFRMRGET